MEFEQTAADSEWQSLVCCSPLGLQSRLRGWPAKCSKSLNKCICVCVHVSLWERTEEEEDKKKKSKGKKQNKRGSSPISHYKWNIHYKQNRPHLKTVLSLSIWIVCNKKQDIPHMSNFIMDTLRNKILVRFPRSKLAHVFSWRILPLTHRIWS